jgi:hypothetical protein
MSPKEKKAEQVGVRLEPALRAALEKEAEALGHTLASYIRFILANRHDRPQKKK